MTTAITQVRQDLDARLNDADDDSGAGGARELTELDRRRRLRAWCEWHHERCTWHFD
jgi:hypothetical protein